MSVCLSVDEFMWLQTHAYNFSNFMLNEKYKIVDKGRFTAIKFITKWCNFLVVTHVEIEYSITQKKICRNFVAVNRRRSAIVQNLTINGWLQNSYEHLIPFSWGSWSILLTPTPTPTPALWACNVWRNTVNSNGYRCSDIARVAMVDPLWWGSGKEKRQFRFNFNN